MARYAYVWSEQLDSRPVEAPPAPEKGKSRLLITEREDGVMIEFDKFYLFVRPK